MNRIHILHVITAPRAEGTPRIVLDWLRTETPIFQSVLFLKKGDPVIYDQFKAVAGSVEVMRPLQSGFGKIYSIISFLKNKTSLEKPLIVIAWTTGQSQWIHIGAFLGGVRRLVIHAGNPPAKQGFLARYVYSWMTFWTAGLLKAKVACCSNYVRSSFQALPFINGKIFYSIHNCFDPSAYIREKNDNRIRKNAIMVATLEPHKDHVTLLKAWHRIEKHNKDYQLILAGDGSLRGQLEHLAISLQLSNLAFLGSRNDIPGLLHQSSVFILSTTYAEGFGTVLLEALAAGLQVIATDVPACREVLKGGEYGTLVPPVDPDALAEAVLTAFRNQESEARILKNIHYASSFNPEQMIRQYIELSEN